MAYRRSTSTISFAAFGLLVLAVALAAAQQPQQAPQDVPAPTLRVTTRLVLADVQVTDKSGQRVTGLTPADFTLMENGKPQRIATFSFEQIGRAARPAPQPMPPNIYTNRPEYNAPPGATTLLLLDGLNTAVQNQAYARLQLLRYLDSQLVPDRRIAVFALGRSLRLLQDFTTDPRLVRAAIESFTLEHSKELAIEDLDKRQLPPPQNPVGPRGNTNAEIATINVRLREFYDEQAKVALNERVETTLAAFRALARAVAGYPGRKSLVWVSAGFPLVVTSRVTHFSTQVTQQNLPMEQQAVDRSYEEDVRQTAAALTDAQMAVYPVDARGLLGGVISDASTSGLNEQGYLRMGAEYSATVAQSSNPRLNTQNTMQTIASETGGQFFTNRNDIDNAVGLSLADGSSYYLLGYYPEDKGWDAKFHRIQVKVNRPNVEVRHRNGYYAVDPTQWTKQVKDKDAELMAAMRTDAPPSTMIIFDARVVPPATSAKMLIPIEFLVDPRTLSSEELPGGGKRYQLDFHVAAITPDGKLAGDKHGGMDAKLKPEQAASVLQGGFPAKLELELAPGRYTLRLAVRDVRTGFIGTAETPLVLGK